MNLPEGFLMLGNDSYMVESTLKDYVRIAEQIRRAKKSGDNGENVTDESGEDDRFTRSPWCCHGDKWKQKASASHP